MEFRVLGPLEVSDGDRSLPLGGPKQRTVLAHLLLQANHLVTVERLIDALWGEEPPGSARNTLQTYIKHLRKLVGAGRIEHLSSGYVLRIDPGKLDLHRFEALVEDSRALLSTDLPAATKGLREALGLWRGPPLDDLAEQPSLRPEIARLEEMRIAAIEERIGAELSLGRHVELVPELQTLVGHHPYRERSWGHLMVALYRSGRQGDALAAYQRAREVLTEELGIDPSPELQRIHQEVLTQDPALELGGEPLRGYRLLELLGEGAFGAVHRAFQPQVGREVAVKVIHPRLTNDPQFVRRFDAEAQLVARLEHPHIVPVYDYWREPGGAYLVMRYLRGGNLRQMLAGGPLEPVRAVRLLNQVAPALAAAHRQGVVHRDVQPANVLFDEEGNAYLSDFGIARDLATARNARSTPGEFAYYLSPEEARGETPTHRADIYSLGLVLYECLTGRRAVGDSPPAELVERHGREPIPSVGSTRPGLPQAVDAVIARATADEPNERYADVLDFAAAAREALADATLVAADLEQGEVRNPYKGLHAFLEADASDFFGREDLIDRLLARLSEQTDAHRFLGVVGPSGSGKSSVVRAGLVPALRAGALPGSDTWFFVQMMPGAHPFEELGAALLGMATNPPSGLVEELGRDEHGLSEAITRVLPPDGSELFLVIDQLEELFTHVDDEQRRARFLASLVSAVEDPASRVRIVVTLRADFYDRPLSYPGFGEVLGRRTETVTPLTAAELTSAIAGPAERVGVTVEGPMVAELVADATNQRGALPLLEYTLTEVFKRRRDRWLTLDAYHEVGGLGGALAGRAEHISAGDGRNEAREAARQLFLRLVNVGEGIEDLRRRVRVSELNAIEGDRDAMSGAIASFTRHRLLTSDRDPVTREPTVEVAHEALLRSWPRLRGWIDSAREDLRNHRQLAGEAAAWASSDRDPSFLLRGSRLDRLEAWAARSSVAVNADEREYLDASIREREAERVVEEARLQRERFLERRSAKRLRVLVGLLTAAALVASALTVIAVGQRREASEQSRVAFARELAASAVANLDVDPERSILLALEAVRTTRADDGTVLPDAEEALHRAVTTSRFIRSLPVEAEALDWSPTGVFVAVSAENDGTIDIRSAETGEPVLTIDGRSGPITDVGFSPDGSMLAAASASGDVVVWDSSSGARVAGMSGRGAASGPSFSGDGSRVAGAWSRAGTVRILDLSTGAVVDVLRDLPGAAHTAVDPLGRMIAVASEAPDCNGERWKVLTIDLDTGRRNVLEGSEPCGSSFVTWSPDGRFIVARDHIWDGGSGALRTKLVGHTDLVDSADWNSDSSRLVTGGDDGTTKVWEIEPGGVHELLSLSAEDVGYVTEVAFSPDGTQVMTNGDARGVLRIWDVSPAGDAEVANLPADSPSWWKGDIGFAAGGRRVVVPNGWGPLAMWDVETARMIGTIGPPLAPEPWGSEPGFEVSLDGTTIAIARGDQTMGLWEAATGQRVFSVEEPRMFSHDPFDLSPSGEYVAVVMGSSGVRIVDRSGRDVGSVAAPEDSSIDAARFSSDGRLIALAIGEGAEIWDWQHERRVSTIPDPSWPGGRMVFDPNGTRLATAGDDRSVKIWDVGTGALVRALPRYPADIYGIVFSPDGSRLAIGGTGGTVRVIDTRSGQFLDLPGDQSGVSRLVFSPDGSLLAAANFDGPARIWTLDIDELLEIARREVTRSLTDEECRQYLHVETCPSRPS